MTRGRGAIKVCFLGDPPPNTLGLASWVAPPSTLRLSFPIYSSAGIKQSCLSSGYHSAPLPSPKALHMEGGPGGRPGGTGGPHPKRRRPTHPDPTLLPRVGLAPPTPPFVLDNLGPLPWVLDTLPSFPPVASPAGLWPTQASLPPSPKRTHLAHKGQPGRKGARGAGFS